MKILGYEITKAAAPKAQQKPQGIMGFKTSSGSIVEEFIRDLQFPAAGKVYQEMSSNDAVIGSCLYLIETVIRGANWDVIMDDPNAPFDEEAIAFVKSCMFDMSGQTWDDFICDALSMLIYGFSFHEIVYKIRRGPLEKDPKFKSKYSDGKIGWQMLAARSQATLSGWDIDKATGKAIAFLQDPSLVGVDGDIVPLQIEGNLLFKTKSAFGNPEGWSVLRRAYRSWYFKKYIEELEGIGIERNLAGIPVLSPPPDVPLFDANNDEMVKLLEWAQTLVNNLRQDKNHGIILPSTEWQLDLLGTNSASKGLDTDVVIRRYEARCAMALLSDVILLGGDRTGSFALAEAKQSLFVSSLTAIVESITSKINQEAIPMLFALNNMTTESYPKIVAKDIETPDIKEVALILRSLKVDITKNKKLFGYILEILHAPSLTKEEFEELMTTAEADNTKPGDKGPGAADEPEADTVDNEGKQTDQAYV